MSLIINNLDKSELKAIIKEVLQEDPNFLKTIIREILQEVGQENTENSNSFLSEEELIARQQITLEETNQEKGFINLSANLATILKEDKEVLQKLAL